MGIKLLIHIYLNYLSNLFISNISMKKNNTLTNQDIQQIPILYII